MTTIGLLLRGRPENKGIVRVHAVAATRAKAANARRSFCFHNNPATRLQVMIRFGPLGATGTDPSTSSCMSSRSREFKYCGSAGGEMKAARVRTQPPNPLRHPATLPLRKRKPSPRFSRELLEYESLICPAATNADSGVRGSAQVNEFTVSDAMAPSPNTHCIQNRTLKVSCKFGVLLLL